MGLEAVGLTLSDSIISNVDIWLSRFTYKPGWDIRIERNPGTGQNEIAQISIIIQVLDSNGTGQTIPIQMFKKFDPKRYKTDVEFYEFLKHTIWLAENHEMMEWFKVDDEKWDDPHQYDLEKLGELNYWPSNHPFSGKRI